MKLEAIYVSNILESYYRSYDKLPEKQKQAWYEYDFLEANRALLYGADNKIVVTSYPIDLDYLKDLKEIVGWHNVINLYPDSPKPSISNDLRQNLELRTRLVNIIKDNPGIKLIQYRSTPEFHRLVNWLRAQNLNFETPELIAAKDEFVLNYYNTKRGFRHLWAETLGQGRGDISIPKGFICGDLGEAIDASWWFANHKKDFVIKYNKGVQGVGVVLNKYKLFSNEKKEFGRQLKEKLHEQMWLEPSIVVEELIEPDVAKLGGSPNVELYINPKGKVNFSYPCEQILENKKKFIGVYFHKDLMKTKQMQAAKKAGFIFGRALSNLGYRGVFDIDMVIGKNGRAYAVEANLRRTGGTHLHELVSNLLGKSYWRNYYVMSLDLQLYKAVSYLEMKEELKNHYYNPKKKSGVILGNPDMLAKKILIPILIAKTKKEIERLLVVATGISHRV